MHELDQQLKAVQLEEEEEEVVSPAVASVAFVEQVETVSWLQLAHLGIRAVKVVKYDRFVHEPLVLVNDIDMYSSRLDRSIEDDIVDNEEGEQQHADDV